MREIHRWIPVPECQAAEQATLSIPASIPMPMRALALSTIAVLLEICRIFWRWGAQGLAIYHSQRPVTKDDPGFHVSQA
jgi:hypothetical protein